MAQFEVVFFDLDGTLVDTAPDLAYALNKVLAEEGKAQLPYEQIRPVASHGSAGLLGLGFGITPQMDSFKPLQQRFISIYQDNLSRQSALFEGMDTIIQSLDNQGTRWGVITNKPAFLTEPLMQDLKLHQRAACIVSGDTTPKSKPDPEPLLHACMLTDADPSQCLYIGDAQRDIEAGRNAHMHTIIARYGYLSNEDNPESWQADAIINHPRELAQWL
ncbi:HAD-IA family hydrolase [Methylophaga sp. OBS4]|uniref:HAD-IA family hydrolase n=1 Tax=Methylophaga sp. OBS4 TaxID=2991935 RepID=UPI002256284C|nr:HAD-IA family hydrolase [Methylophaga sp. OBS4]MCX4187275.1 HAD-IA family hydrolase [Methylophaga sp. OBS4]